MADTIFDVLRVVNIAMGLIALFLCITKASHYWGRYSNTSKAFALSLTLFAFATVWASGEQIAQQIPPGSRSITTTVALACLLYALWTTRGRSFYIEFRPDREVPPPGSHKQEPPDQEAGGSHKKSWGTEE